MHKATFERFVARITSPPVVSVPTRISTIDKLRTARAQLVDPARIAAIDALLAAPEALAAMTATQVNKRLLDILLGK